MSDAKNNSEPTKTETSVDVDVENSEHVRKLKDGEWMIKPCFIYRAEYKECKSIKGRFQQHFVHGEQSDCLRWKKDWDNCEAWKKKRDYNAFAELLESEKRRRLERLEGHVANDVWTRREKPPDDWTCPLPEWMIKRDEGTFLAAKQKNLAAKGYDDELDLFVPGRCTIL